MYMIGKIDNTDVRMSDYSQVCEKKILVISDFSRLTTRHGYVCMLQIMFTTSRAGSSLGLAQNLARE